ncbi:NAD(P)-binding protein [Gordonia sp. TBRC 11910]|uniref:NAD(P)-binding protein n=1 Tax=Gordonia asplenii TaxID=2725283 RepID=A0A848KZB4_9ACTN|nr:FAD-dependent monooxygenase [Gordonia asplenii]NMO03729.1 NAD(P)-binding protein [Gordonia asplenii]
MLVQKVLIVGAGIGGLGLAALLGQRGVAVTVVEKRSDATVLGVGINQPANSLRALRAIGVLDDCLRIGYAHTGNTFYDWHGDLIVDCPSHLGGPDVPANCAISRAQLKDLLLTAAEEAHSKIRYGVEVEHIADNGDQVLVRTSDGAQEFYDLVVGFDGARSGIRDYVVGTPVSPAFSGYGVWRKTMPRAASVANTQLFQGDRTKAGVIPLSDDSMYLFVVTPEPGNPHHRPEDFGALLSERLAGYTGLIGELRESITDSDGIVYSPLSELLLPAPWNRGRVVVLGDAAHLCAPHLTQGAGMALEDAIVLADELAEQPDIATALSDLMIRRHDRVKLVHDASHAILVGEMAVDAAGLPDAIVHMRETLPGQTEAVDRILNQPF